MKVKFTNIDWDTDGVKTKLPRSVVMHIPDSKINIEYEGADILSDHYGFCVNYFQFKILDKRDT